MKSAAAHSTDAAARTWAMAAHLSALSLNLGMIFANLLFPDRIWCWQKKRSGFTAEHALESLNYQFTFTAAIRVSLMVAFFSAWAWLLVMAVDRLR